VHVNTRISAGIYIPSLIVGINVDIKFTLQNLNYWCFNY